MPDPGTKNELLILSIFFLSITSDTPLADQVQAHPRLWQLSFFQKSHWALTKRIHSMFS